LILLFPNREQGARRPNSGRAPTCKAREFRGLSFYLSAIVDVMKASYDVVILGAGHNGLVAAAYLVRAGLRVLLLGESRYIGGATASHRVFPDYTAQLSRYAYLVSLFPEKIIRDLGLNFTLRRRAVASFTPYVREGQHRGLLMSNVSEETSRESLLELTGSDTEFERLNRFYLLARVFAEEVWPTVLEPLVAREEFRRRFQADEVHREAWRSLIEEPLGCAVERYLQDDLLRGVVFTDAKIGLFTHPHDETLLQNRCFLYHVIGNKTGEWKVPVGGMGQVATELERTARRGGAEIATRVQINALDLSAIKPSVLFEVDGKSQTVEARFLLVNFGRNILAKLVGKPFQPDATHDGSVFKINMLLRRLPRLKAERHPPADAFCGTFHCDEAYEQMKASYQQASQGVLPEKLPCEVYCHTLTDDSILAPELRGFHTMTLFGLDVPWSLFQENPQTMRDRAQAKFLHGMNRWLAEPLEDYLAVARDGSLCIESKSPVDIESELGHYHGNIFHSALTFPFAESEEQVGDWGVETEFERVFICGSSARRGGAVSGIPGHNAAMKVLERINQQTGAVHGYSATRLVL
jgi:phytoene dehydrogenase-like protein